MKKIFLFIALLVGNFGVLSYAQTDTPNNQSDYSESVSYEPRVNRDVKGRIVDAYGKIIKEKKVKSSEKADGRNEQSITQAASESKDFILPIYVSNKDGQPVTDLTIQVFELFINETEQKIEDVQINNAPLNIIIALDVSNSTTDNLKDLKNFALQMIEHLGSDSQVKIVAFDEKIHVLSPFTEDRNVLKSVINKMKAAGGGTSLYEFNENILKNQLDGKTIILQLTDGVDTTSEKASYESSLKTVEQSDAIIFPLYFNTENLMLGATDYKNYSNSTDDLVRSILRSLPGMNPQQIKADYERGRNYLLDTTAISGGRLFEIKKLNGLTNEDFDYIAKNVQPQYLLKFRLPEAVYPDKRVKIKIRISIPSLIIKTQGSRITS